jgi:hypothetical protein
VTNPDLHYEIWKLEHSERLGRGAIRRARQEPGLARRGWLLVAARFPGMLVRRRLSR